MSQISKTTLDQAIEAKKALGEKLLKDFLVAVGGPIGALAPVRISTAEWGVEVRLSRELTKEEKEIFPKKQDGVHVIYKVVGPQNVKPQEP